MVFNAINNLSLNAMAIKELRLPEMTGLIQGVSQTVGFFIGSLLLLKATSLEFAEFIGLSRPITTPPVIIRTVCVLIALTVLFIHLKYK